MKSGIEIIAEERKRQIEVEGWTPEEDDLYTAGQLALAGATYAIPTFCRDDYGGYVYSTDVPIMVPFQSILQLKVFYPGTSSHQISEDPGIHRLLLLQYLHQSFQQLLFSM